MKRGWGMASQSTHSHPLHFCGSRFSAIASCDAIASLVRVHISKACRFSEQPQQHASPIWRTSDCQEQMPPDWSQVPGMTVAIPEMCILGLAWDLIKVSVSEYHLSYRGAHDDCDIVVLLLGKYTVAHMEKFNRFELESSFLKHLHLSISHLNSDKSQYERRANCSQLSNVKAPGIPGISKGIRPSVLCEVARIGTSRAAHCSKDSPNSKCLIHRHNLTQNTSSGTIGITMIPMCLYAYMVYMMTQGGRGSGRCTEPHSSLQYFHWISCLHVKWLVSRCVTALRHTCAFTIRSCNLSD